MQSGDDLTYNKPREAWKRLWLKYRFRFVAGFDAE